MNGATSETPIFIDWTYNYPGLAPKLAENNITYEINVPSDGVYSGYYAQGVVAGSPHPNAAKLWIDHIISDEGALGYIQGGAVPARYAALVAAALAGRAEALGKAQVAHGVLPFPADAHHVGLDEEFLTQYLQDAGFVDIARVEGFGLFDDASNMQYKLPVSLNMQARKPG